MFGFKIIVKFTMADIFFCNLFCMCGLVTHIFMPPSITLMSIVLMCPFRYQYYTDIISLKQGILSPDCNLANYGRKCLPQTEVQLCLLKNKKAFFLYTFL